MSGFLLQIQFSATAKITLKSAPCPEPLLLQTMLPSCVIPFGRTMLKC